MICLQVCLWTTCVADSCWGQKRASYSLGLELHTDSFGLSCDCWELHLGPLVLTTKPLSNPLIFMNFIEFVLRRSHTAISYILITTNLTLLFTSCPWCIRLLFPASLIPTFIWFIFWDTLTLIIMGLKVSIEPGGLLRECVSEDIDFLFPRIHQYLIVQQERIGPPPFMMSSWLAKYP